MHLRNETPIFPLLAATSPVADGCLGASLKLLVGGTKGDDGLGEDMLVQSRLELLGKLFGVLLFLSRNLVAVLVKNWRLLLRCFGSMHEHSVSLLVVFGVAIKHVTTVLTIVPLESPANGRVDDVFGNANFLAVCLNVLFDLLFDLDRTEVIVRVTLNSDVDGSVGFREHILGSCFLIAFGGLFRLRLLFSFGLLFAIRGTFFSFLLGLLSGSLFISQLSLALFTRLSTLIHESSDLGITLRNLDGVTVLLLLVPGEDLLDQPGHVDVRHVVVLSELLRVKTLASARRTLDDDLDRAQASLLLEFLLDEVDASRKARLAEPINLNEVLILGGFFSCWLLTLSHWWWIIFHEQFTRLDVQIKQQ